MGDPGATTIKIDSGSTKKYLEQIKTLRNHNSYNQTVITLIDVYSPFLNPKVDKALKKIAQKLVTQGQIPTATEAEVVEFALKFLMVNMLQPGPLEPKPLEPGPLETKEREFKPILKPEGEEPKPKPESHPESKPKKVLIKGGEEVAGGEKKISD